MSMLDELTAAVDAVCGADPAALADGEALVVLHRQLARLEAVTARAAAGFEAAGGHHADGARTPAHHCHIDHTQPWAAGGPTTPTNGRPACPHHNHHRHHPRPP